MMLPRFLFGMTVAISAAGCAAVTEPFGLEDPFAVPKPFQGVERNDLMLAQAVEVPAVVVVAPLGMNGAVAIALRDRVVVTANAHDIPALVEPTVRSWVLDASVMQIMTSERPVRERSVVSWRLADDQGSERARFSVRFEGKDAELSEAALRALAEQTIAELDAALRRPGTQVAEDRTAAASRAVVWIGAVKGAPGDGNKTLSEALRGLLPLKGVRVGSLKSEAQWRIEGLIKVVRASTAQDTVTLTWRVLDAKGKEAGTIVQENAVPHGRLSKSWAEVGRFAAEAAAEGIVQLIQQVSAAKPG